MTSSNQIYSNQTDRYAPSGVSVQRLFATIPAQGIAAGIDYVPTWNTPTTNTFPNVPGTTGIQVDAPGGIIIFNEPMTVIITSVLRLIGGAGGVQRIWALTVPPGDQTGAIATAVQSPSLDACENLSIVHSFLQGDEIALYFRHDDVGVLTVQPPYSRIEMVRLY